MNNLIVCFTDEQMSIFTLPMSPDATTILTRQIQLTTRIEQLNILYESAQRTVLAVKSNNGETTIYQLNKQEATSREWNINELNVAKQSNAVYSIPIEKNIAGEQILQAVSNEQKLNFYVSKINEYAFVYSRTSRKYG
jgi:hypothetical protein